MDPTGGGDESGDEVIRANVTDEEVNQVFGRYFGLTGGQVKKLLGYDDLNYHYVPIDGTHGNPHMATLSRHGYVLKITNSHDSKFPDSLEMQNDAMLLLRQKNVGSPVPVKSVSGDHSIKLKFPLESAGGEQTQKEHIVRLLEYQPGTMLKDVPMTYHLLYELGQFVAKLTEVLKTFPHQKYSKNQSKWHFRNAGDVREYLDFVEDVQRRQMTAMILDEFVEKVLPRENDFENGFIHGDINENNLLLVKTPGGDWTVSSILDFGDSHVSNYVFEVAIALCYIMLHSCRVRQVDPVMAAGHFLAGYVSLRPHYSVDTAVLKVCICARLCQSLVLGLQAFSLCPDNHYVLGSQDRGWELLEKLWAMPTEEIDRVWTEAMTSYKVPQS